MHGLRRWDYCQGEEGGRLPTLARGEEVRKEASRPQGHSCPRGQDGGGRRRRHDEEGGRRGRHVPPPDDLPQQAAIRLRCDRHDGRGKAGRKGQDHQHLEEVLHRQVGDGRDDRCAIRLGRPCQVRSLRQEGQGELQFPADPLLLRSRGAEGRPRDRRERQASRLRRDQG